MTALPRLEEEPSAAQSPTEFSEVGTLAVPQNIRSRISAAWFGMVAAALVLVLRMIFIFQNMRSVKITHVTLSGTIPVGVALLFAAIGGLLLAGLVASLRIWQLHHRVTQGEKET
ncbi:MAG TPA: hypothetical protein VN886_23940 [Acidimicrobiales bacterium]|jgi:uncharacterized integral membrane protein|nr:hypothetical protein [Acidimicrobiales bacterium]